jgi:hypothetical protein
MQERADRPRLTLFDLQVYCRKALLANRPQHAPYPVAQQPWAARQIHFVLDISTITLYILLGTMPTEQGVAPGWEN